MSGSFNIAHLHCQQTFFGQLLLFIVFRACVFFVVMLPSCTTVSCIDAIILFGKTSDALLGGFDCVLEQDASHKEHFSLFWSQFGASVGSTCGDSPVQGVQQHRRALRAAGACGHGPRPLERVSPWPAHERPGGTWTGFGGMDWEERGRKMKRIEFQFFNQLCLLGAGSYFFGGTRPGPYGWNQSPLGIATLQTVW